MRRLTEAIDLLAPAGITVTALDAGQATAVLAAACNPDSLIPPSAGLAGADEVITTASAESWDDSRTTVWGPTSVQSLRAERPLIASAATGSDDDTGDVDDSFDEDFDDEDFDGEYAA
jgi:hypothetical protein